MSARFAKALAAVALFNGVLYFSLPDAYGSNEDDAKKYAMELKSGKDAKTKINALNELAKLAVIMTSYVSEDALKDIYTALEDKDAGVRGAAAACLGACDQPAEKVVPSLIKILKDDKDEAAKMGAIRGLGSMGPAAKKALPELRELTGDKKSKLSGPAKMAIKSIAPKN